MSKNKKLGSTIINQEQITAEVLAILFKDTTKSFIVSMCVALILVVVLADEMSSTSAIIWLTMLLCAYTLRLGVVHFHAKNQFQFSKPSVWLNRFRLTSALCGLAWGAASLLLFPYNNITQQTMLALFVGGICAGALINYSIDKLTAFAFTACATLLFISAYLIEQNNLSMLIALMMLIFIAYVAFASKKLATGILSNITLRIEAENQQKKIVQMSEKQNFHLAHTPLGLIDWDTNLTITAWNKACTSMLGYSINEAIGMHISFIMPEMINKSTAQIMHIITNADDEHTGLKEIFHKNGSKVYCEWFNTPLKNEAGELIGIASLVQDKTEFIAHQEKIYQLAYFDALTDLPNRGLLMDRINHALAASKRSKTYSMLAFIDLDHFKTINDIKGHSSGDYLLKTIAKRLQQSIRQEDTAARLGGDEFVLVLSNIGSTKLEAEEYSKKIIEKISQLIDSPVYFDNYRHQCSASIGLCLFNDDSLDATELLRRADVSMYLSKKQGRNTYQFYDDSKQPQYEYQLKLKHDLNHAVEKNQFKLYLQGQYNCVSKITGAEVLLRWQHPELGIVSPSDFIPLAEETGAIVPIGYWVLKEACTLLKKWQPDASTSSLMLSVNVSALQFSQPDFVNQTKDIVLESGCDATKLCIELTESSVVTNIEESIAKMHQIKALGISLSIDDFGTGYSSLSALKTLPLSELKIDRSFVKDFAESSVDLTIVQTILQMGKNLNLHIVAEGVETEGQLALLCKYGCREFQGYYFAKPCSISYFEHAISENKPDEPATNDCLATTLSEKTRLAETLRCEIKPSKARVNKLRDKTQTASLIN